MVLEYKGPENRIKNERVVEGIPWTTLEKCSREVFIAAEMLDDSSFPKFLIEGNHTESKFVGLINIFKEDGIVFLDDKENVLAAGFSAPLHLEHEELPKDGWEGGVKEIIDTYKQHKTPNTLMALSAVVSLEARGQGLGDKILNAFLQRAKELGLSRVIVPARPINKNAFPDTTMQEYVNLYDNETNKHVDPWIRAHLRQGGKIAGIGKDSHVIHSDKGKFPSVEKWQKWTGMNFDKDGFYDIPGGNAKLHIHNGIGEYREDCIWIVYDV